MRFFISLIDGRGFCHPLINPLHSPDDPIHARSRRRKKFGGELYLHRSMEPLDVIDLEATRHEKQVSLMDECEGMCGM